MAEADSVAAKKWDRNSLAQERAAIEERRRTALQKGSVLELSAADAAERQLDKRLAVLNPPEWAAALPRPSRQQLAEHEFPVIHVGQAPFSTASDGLKWAKQNGIVQTIPAEQTQGVGTVDISVASIREMLNPSQRIKSPSPQIHFAAVAELPQLIRSGLVADRHVDLRKDKSGVRTPAAGVNKNVAVDVLYAAMSYGTDAEPYRVKITLKRHADKNQPTKAYAYSVEEIEVLSGALANSGASAGIDPKGRASIPGRRLLFGVLDVKGRPLVDMADASATAGGPPASGSAPGAEAPGKPFALDGGTPAEIDAQKARAVEAQKRRELEEQAAAPGKNLGTVSIQEGLPGLGGDGTLFTPPPGGWGARGDQAPAPRSPGSGAMADGEGAPPSMLEEAIAERAQGTWGDETKTVPVVGDGAAAWQPRPGMAASDAKKELQLAAEQDVQAQQNSFYDSQRKVHGLVIDGIRHYLNPSGMLHGIIGRRGAANGAAVARIGTVLNASVAVPGVPGDQVFRIAPVDFGRPGHALFVFDKVGGENKLTDVLVLHSLNVKAGTAARPRLATDDSRPTRETLAQLRNAWQVDILPGLKERARQKAAKAGAFADAAPEPAVRPSTGSVAADEGAAPREAPAKKRAREDASLVQQALDALTRNQNGEGNVEELGALADRLEARSLYGSAAMLRRANGEAALRPGLSTEGGHALWPAQEPGTVRVALTQLVDIARKLGGGVAPGVARRLHALGGR
ncbi:MAG: hypothetical protein IJ678_09505, partial [Kiritimatiellae bacterium]|nr:hypothetical protein [Kiritimatiellia bacterium]